MNTIRQNSRARNRWDFLIIVLIFVSSVIIPYQIAFDHNRKSIADVIIYLIDCFFILDIWLNFRTTYREHGIEITDRNSIRSHYLRTLFPLDALSNFPFDLVVLIMGEVSLFNISLVLLLRLFRLLRAFRMFHIFNRWAEQSWSNTGLLRIQKFLLSLVLTINGIACFWFFTAYIDRFPADSWVVRAGIENLPASTQYMRSLYWAIVTMTTVGYGDITPGRDIEYLLAIIVILLGASTYAFMIGNIASLISRIDASKTNYWNRIDSANQYLRYKQIPDELNDKVRKYYEYVWAKHRGLSHTTLLQDLPLSLRYEVTHYLAKELLERVPLFRHSSDTLKHVLLLSLEPQIIAPEGYIARAGEPGREMYFISKGNAEIIGTDGTSVYDTLTDGDYFGDIALLLKERRTASVRSVTYCEIFKLSRAKFEEIETEYPEFREVVKKISTERTERTAKMVIDGIIL